MKRISILIIALFGIALSGCMTPGASSSNGTPINAEKVAQIQKGKTTRAEVETLLGKPTNVGMAGDGKRTMTYMYTETDARIKSFVPIPFVGVGTRVAATHRIQHLQIMLTKDGIVDDFEFSDDTKVTDSKQGIGGGSSTTTQ